MSGNKTTITLDDCLKGAMAALLRGDLAERDRLCKLAEGAFRAGDEEVPGDTDVLTGKSPAQEAEAMREQIEPWMLDRMVYSVQDRLGRTRADLVTGFWDSGLPFTLEEREMVCGALDAVDIPYVKVDVLDSSSKPAPPSYILIVGRTLQAAQYFVAETRRYLERFQREGRGLAVSMVEHPTKAT